MGLAVLPTSTTETSANNVSLRTIDRTFVSSEGSAYWTLSQIDSNEVVEEVIGFATGDDINLDSSLSLRQNYKLDTNQIPGLTEKITLRLNGQNIRERIGELKL